MPSASVMRAHFCWVLWPCLLQSFCEKEGLSFIETSALEATNVEQASILCGARCHGLKMGKEWE